MLLSWVEWAALSQSTSGDGIHQEEWKQPGFLTPRFAYLAGSVFSWNPLVRVTCAHTLMLSPNDTAGLFPRWLLPYRYAARTCPIFI